MNKKLEILVVEDNPENLAVAKSFYNSQTDLKIDYATYRDEAIEMLEKNKYDGVITDRSIPAFLGDKNKENWYAYMENNGWSVALLCELKDIPWVMHSEHGGSNFILPEKKKQFPKELAKIIYDKFIVDSNIDNEEEYDKTTIGTIYHTIPELGKNIPHIYENTYDHRDRGSNHMGKEAFLAAHITDLKKLNPESWKIALDYLKQLIESRK